MLGLSPQAVSKWENDITCPDISLLPKLAKTLGVSIDELLCGKSEFTTKLVPIEERKDLTDMILRIVVNSSEGDNVRVNLPMALVQAAVEIYPLSSLHNTDTHLYIFYEIPLLFFSRWLLHRYSHIYSQ